MRQKDSAEAGPGYTCYGGPGVGSPQTLLVWAPGSVPMRAPEGTTMRVSKGSVLVSQVHYNLAQFDGKGDRSVAHMEITKTAPQQVVTLLPIADPGKLKIPAGAKPTVFAAPTANAANVQVLYKAYWNLFLLTNDNTFGIHNPGFYNAVLTATSSQLKVLP